MADLQQLLTQAQQAITDAADLQALDQVRVQYLGKKGVSPDTNPCNPSSETHSRVR